MTSFKEYINLNESGKKVTFSRLLYINKKLLRYVIEFDVGGEKKLWYSMNFYQGWNMPDHFKENLSSHCILQKQTNLSYLFFSTPITHFDKDLPNVENTENMFKNCKDLIYFKSKMPNVKDTKNMFEGCSDKFFKKYPEFKEL